MIPALLALGALVGPVQPINAELAVEVAYPADENSIEALQQLCGNLFSALLVRISPTKPPSPPVRTHASMAFSSDTHLVRTWPPQVPVAERAAHVDLQGPGGTGVHGDTVLLGFIALGAFGYFTTFNAELKRSEVDCEADDAISSCDVVYATIEAGETSPVLEQLAADCEAEAERKGSDDSP